MATTAETKQFIRKVRIEQDRRNALKFETIANLADFKTKLNGIEAGAQVNVIENISIDGTNQTVTEKGVALNLSAYAKKSDVAASVRVKGTVANFAALPANAEVGDMYHITAAGGTDENGVAIKAGDNVVKTATGWDNFGGTTDLSNYVQKDGTKVLSTNDFTDAYKQKIDDLETAVNTDFTDADLTYIFADEV